ncbi:MAG: DMT family transporter [Clostridiales bacterium]|nr:DMT family transporter [Clostridiales bacterium]
MNERKGEFIVGLALALRGSSLLFGKIALRTMGPFLLMGTRFIIAFVLIGLIFHKQLVKVTRTELWHCTLLGFFFFLSMAFELNGLKTTPSSVTAFLEGSVVVTVPVITCIVTRKLPTRMVVLTSIIALLGVGFLTLKGGRIGFTTGELLILTSAMWYSITVLITDKAAKNDDPMVIAIYQLLFISLFAFAGAFIWEDIRLPQNTTEWSAILALALICSGLGFTLQPLGQKYITPERAGLLSVFNPLSASTLGIIFLGEKITWSIFVGSLLIIISIFLPSFINKKPTTLDENISETNLPKSDCSNTEP